MTIISDYPGGNIKLISVSGDNTVKLEQDVSDTARWWFYWNFKVEDSPCGEVSFSFQNGDVVCPYGPATSTDGVNWEWLGRSRFIDHKNFRYTFDRAGEDRYFAFSIPYQVSHFESFYAERLKGRVCRSVFAVSEKGRELPLLTFGRGGKDIMLTARHHCCESTASYALEGVITALLDDHSGLLDRFTFHVVPFVDIDGVEAGDQGKDRVPHDHNRDYIDEPIYSYTRAMYKYSEGLRLRCFLDFHSPWSWGRLNNIPHIHFGPPIGSTPEMQNVFAETLREITARDEGDDIIRYDNRLYVSNYGDSANKIGTPSSKNYFAFKRNANMSVSIETPYSGNLSEGYTVPSLRFWGKNIAEALCETIKKENL